MAEVSFDLSRDESIPLIVARRGRCPVFDAAYLGRRKNNGIAIKLQHVQTADITKAYGKPLDPVPLDSKNLQRREVRYFFGNLPDLVLADIENLQRRQL